MLIRFILVVDVLAAYQRLLLGTACALIIYHVIVCLLLIHCGFVTEKWNWSIGEWHSIWGILAWWCRMIVVILRRLLRYVHAVWEIFFVTFSSCFSRYNVDNFLTWVVSMTFPIHCGSLTMISCNYQRVPYRMDPFHNRTFPGWGVDELAAGEGNRSNLLALH